MNCVIIKKNCQFLHTKFNKELYKLCGFKNTDFFGLRFTWNYNNYYISLYSKSNGNAGNENKYDLPPPLDNKLYFGNIIIIAHKSKKPKIKNILNFTINDWKKFYNYAFGGFENINSESEEDGDEYEEIPKKFLTQNNYSMESGFVVDDNEDIEILSDFSEDIMGDSDFYISDTENDDETEEEHETEEDEEEHETEEDEEEHKTEEDEEEHETEEEEHEEEHETEEEEHEHETEEDEEEHKTEEDEEEHETEEEEHEEEHETEEEEHEHETEEKKFTGFIGSGNINDENMIKIKESNLKKYIDMKDYKSVNELTKLDKLKLNPTKSNSEKIKEYNKTIDLYLKEIKKLGNSEIFNNSNTTLENIYNKYFGNYNKKEEEIIGDLLSERRKIKKEKISQKNIQKDIRNNIDFIINEVD